MAELIYKICPKALWDSACLEGRFVGMPIDLADGFVHFSAAAQVAETAARHFAGQDELMLIAFDADDFADALKWEPSRGGALFPHVYGAVDPSLAVWTRPLPLGPDGNPLVPELER